MKMTVWTPLRHSFIKGSYMVLFMIWITPSLFAQNHSWEIGVGLRPQTLKREPYRFLFKKHLSNPWKLRLGISTLFNMERKEHSYHYTYQDSAHHYYEYDYVKKDKNFYISGLVGFQYGKKINGVLIYEATDFTGRYEWDYSSPWPIHFENSDMRPNETATIALIKNNKIGTIGLQQSWGFQFYVTSDISISVEGGLLLSLERFKNEEESIAISAFEGSTSFGGSGITNQRITWNFQTQFSPLTFLAFNYHF